MGKRMMAMTISVQIHHKSSAIALCLWMGFIGTAYYSDEADKDRKGIGVTYAKRIELSGSMGHKKRVCRHYICRPGFKDRRLPTLPPCGSTIGVKGLNFSVRNGKRWIPLAIATI